MPRPLDHQKRREIVDRAFEVILERGVAKTTMSHIAAALGMKRPTLYWYFSDLDTLLEAVAEGLEGRLAERVVGAMVGCDHPIDQLLAMLQAATAFYEEERSAFEGLVRLWAARPGGYGALTDRDVRQREFLSELVRQGMAAGRIRSCDPEGLVQTMFALIDGAVLRMVAVGVSSAPMIAFAREHLLEPLRLPPLREAP